MIRTLLFDRNQKTLTEGDEEQITAWQNNPDSTIWIDFFEEKATVESDTMKKTFGLHPLAITDAQRERHPAKIEAFKDHTFLLLKGLSAETTTMDFATIQIALFVGERFLVTRHSGPSVSIDKLWAETKDTHQTGAQHSFDLQPDALAVRPTRFVVNHYIPILLDLEKRLDNIEQEMIDRPQDTLLFELIENKTNLKKMRRIMAYHTADIAQLNNPRLKGEGFKGCRLEIDCHLRFVHLLAHRCTF